MKQTLYIKTLVNGVGVPFPTKEAQARLSQYSYTAQRMGGAPTLAGTVMSDSCMDDMWTGREYVEFRGEKYFILNTPSSTLSNDDVRYKHDITFISERVALEHEYFYDVVADSPNDPYREGYRSNTSSFNFFGTLRDFVQRLNDAIRYVGLDYTVVVDSGVENPDKEVSFSDKRIAEALQEISNTYEAAYYFVGKTIHVGYTENVISTIFEQGKDKGLLSVQKTNSNSLVVNRITGRGSSENIPYYYPNDDEGGMIPYAANLMPSIYRESKGMQRYYDAVNGKYQIEGLNQGETYYFPNPYSVTNPIAAIQNFDDIKPSIKGVRDSNGNAVDHFADVAYDEGDSDELNDNKEYVHPYFYIRLPKFDGAEGFNLFTHALESESAKIEVTSGDCTSCVFEIMVDKKEAKDENGKPYFKFFNPVQVDEKGDIVSGGQSEKINLSHIQDRQQDTSQYSVWVAVKKDNSTNTNLIMPNRKHLLLARGGDRYVITGIRMPKSYIIAAEHRLDTALIEYMQENNVEKFNFSIKFSRIYLEKNPNIAAILNENARLSVRYNDQVHTLYVTNYSVKGDDSILEEVDVTLAEDLGVAQSALALKLSEAKQDIIQSIGLNGSADILAKMNKYFLRKDQNDRSNYNLSARQMGTLGFSQGGILGAGSGMFTDEQGRGCIETDYLTVRMKAIFQQLEINKVSYTAGDIIAGHAGNKIVKVVPIVIEDNGAVRTEGVTAETCTHFRCHFMMSDGDSEVVNAWAVGDLARCQTFNITANGNKFYWLMVETVGDDYIDLKREREIADTDKVQGATVTIAMDRPEEGDEVVQMGNVSDKERMGGVMLTVNGPDAPALKMYQYVNKPVLDANVNFPTIISPHGTKLTGDVFSYSPNSDPIPVIVFLGEWEGGVGYTYMNEVTHDGSTWRCIYQERDDYGNYLPTTEEPSILSAHWLFLNGSAEDPLLMKFYIDGVETTFGTIGYGEGFRVDCEVYKGFKDITHKVTSWTITRDTGKENDDRVWNNAHRHFNGSMQAVSADIADDRKNIFTVTAVMGDSQTIRAELEI